MAKLLIQESAGVREFEIVDNEVQMGRELDNSLRIPDPSVSRHHAVIRRTPVGFEVEDLQSSNGVLLNGTRVQNSPLLDGDRLTLGQIHITFSDPRPASEGATTEVPVMAENPLGTVRMGAEDIAKIQAGLGSTPGTPQVPAAPVTQFSMVPPPVVPPPAAPPTFAARPPSVPALPPEARSTAINPPDPDHDHNSMGSVTYAPGPLKNFLPPIPDDAEPLMNGGLPERGDFVTRLVAHLIDGAIFIVPMIVLMLVSMLLMPLVFSIVGPFAMSGCGCIFMLLYGILGLGMLLFLPWCWITFGATPGKKIMKLRVVPEDDPKGRIDVSAAMMRILGHFINGLLFFLPYLMILGEDRKGIQDILSKSIVIKVDR